MPIIVKRDGFRVVIDPLGNKDLSEKPYLITVEGDISDKDVAKALNLVCENQSELLIKWSEIHGS